MRNDRFIYKVRRIHQKREDRFRKMNWTANFRQFGQFAVADTFQKEPEDGTDVLLDGLRFSFYIVMSATFLTALLFIIYWYCDMWVEASVERARARATDERSRLILPEEEFVGRPTYGTNEEDLESGIISSSSEDLYNGKICFICYDNKINCFFVPCGHSVACDNCARRIMNVGKKRCPICRGIIDEVTIN